MSRRMPTWPKKFKQPVLSAVCVDRAGSAGLDPIPTWARSLARPDQALLGAVFQQNPGRHATAPPAPRRPGYCGASGHRKESVGPHVVCDCHGVRYAGPVAPAVSTVARLMAYRLRCRYTCPVSAEITRTAATCSTGIDV